MTEKEWRGERRMIYLCAALVFGLFAAAPFSGL
jgi:hypothetical protein